jgi:hypothetical protein
LGIFSLGTNNIGITVLSFFDLFVSPALVFFGLQYILKKWLEGVVLTQEMIEEAAVLFHRPPSIFNREGEFITQIAFFFHGPHNIFGFEGEFVH